MRLRHTFWTGFFIAGYFLEVAGPAGAQETVATNAESQAVVTAGVAGDFGSRGVRAHDPSTIVRCGNRYWVFHTGRGVASYWSKDLMRWEAGPRVFAEPPAWVSREVPENRNAHFWAPDIIHLNDRYLLYYSVSSFGKNTSVIALATNPTLDPDNPEYSWTDRGIVVRSFATNQFNAIDPAVTQDAAGRLWLSFGSFWSGIQLIELDPATGLRIAPDSPMHALARTEAIEAPFIQRHGSFYYLFVNWGICCRGVNSTYEIRVGRSDKISGPYLDDRGADLLQGGGKLLLDSQPPFIGPGHAGIYSENGTNWFSCHFYDGARRGAATLSIRPLRWANGWPVVDVVRVQSR